MDTILMVGEQRSGSNLLRLILNQSSEIAGPHPPHILQRFMPLLPLYGDLDKERSFCKLIDDVCKLIETNPVPWEGVTFNRKDVRKRCQDNSLVSIFSAVMAIYAESQDARGWICKSMQNIRWAEEIDKHFINPKYIYLYRDPRDVTLSFMKAVIGEKHPYFIAQQWAELQRLCLEERDKIGPSQFFSIGYEDLTARPLVVVKALCEFLEIDFVEDMLSFHQSGEANRAAHSSNLWKNVVQPIMSHNSKKFMKEMSYEEIGVVESVCGDIMDVLGYERVYVQPGEEQNFSKADIAHFTRENERTKKAMAKNTDPEDLERRRRQAKVIENIKAMAS